MAGSMQTICQFSSQSEGNLEKSVPTSIQVYSLPVKQFLAFHWKLAFKCFLKHFSSISEEGDGNGAVYLSTI